MRVVSLLPSATEILASIGGEDLLVARSHECDHPPHLPESLRVLTAQRDAPESGVSPAGIDERVRTLRTQSLPLYTLDEDLLRELRPDLILTQDLCDVCSIDLATVERVAATMEPAPRVLALNPTTIEGVFDDVLRVGSAVGLDRNARDLAVSLRNRMHAAAEHVNQFEEGPVVGFMEWTDPIYIAGHWTVQLIERAGGRHPLNETVARPGSGAAVGPQQAERVAGRSIAVTPDIFTGVRPEAVVVCPCGVGLGDASSQARSLLDQDWFCALPAARAGRVAAVDGNQMFNRPGPRLVDAFEWLVGWLQNRPELIPAGFPWEPIDTSG
ncbi:MAG: ABC transporter substrate-binding protein [Phycisphaerales bacterium JB040]